MFEKEIYFYFLDLIDEVSYEEFKSNYSLRKLIERHKENYTGEEL